jgi:hypothetical protein
MKPPILRTAIVACLLLPLIAGTEPLEQTRVRRFEGELTKVSEDSISVKPVRRGEEKSGIEWTVAVDDKTKVVRSVPDDRSGRRGFRTEPAALSDLSVGQHVRVKADAERADEINIIVPAGKR